MDDLERRFTRLVTQLRDDDPVPRAELDHRVRRVQRRRRTAQTGIAAAVVIVIAAVTVGIVRDRRATPDVRVVSPSTVPTSTPRPRPSVQLPSNYTFTQIAATGSGLLLSGRLGSGDASVCASTVVNAETLQLGLFRDASCDDPATLGATIGVRNTYLGGSNNATIRVARVDRGTDRVSYGPVVMTYSVGSTSRPESAVGGGRLWIYDVATTHGPELLQVSATSGRVVNTVAMPSIFRPIMAATDAGLWFGPSISGGGPSALYYIGAGSAAPQVAVAAPESVCWMLGAGSNVWVGIGPTCLQQTISRFEGSGLQPAFSVADAAFDPTTVVGNEAEGLWTMQWRPPLGGAIRSSARGQDIVRIDPDTGAERVLARLPPVPVPVDALTGQGLVSGQAAIFNGWLYLLEPAVGASDGYGSLVRVPLPVASAASPAGSNGGSS